MRKVKHIFEDDTFGDKEEEWYWEEEFDGCTYGFGCDMWTKERAIESFKQQIKEHLEFEKMLKKSIKQ